MNNDGQEAFTPFEHQPRTCENCAFFEPNESPEIGEGDGECRRHSPRFLTHQDWDSDEPSYHGFWPEVNRDEWCGEYRRRLKGRQIPIQSSAAADGLFYKGGIASSGNVTISADSARDPPC